LLRMILIYKVITRPHGLLTLDASDSHLALC
jgi:hypothetical protein